MALQFYNKVHRTLVVASKTTCQGLYRLPPWHIRACLAFPTTALTDWSSQWNRNGDKLALGTVFLLFLLIHALLLCYKRQEASFQFYWKYLFTPSMEWHVEGLKFSSHLDCTVIEFSGFKKSLQFTNANANVPNGHIWIFISLIHGQLPHSAEIVTLAESFQRFFRSLS